MHASIYVKDLIFSSNKPMLTLKGGGRKGAAGTVGSTQNASTHGEGGRQEAQGSQAGDVWFLH
jgi:hypothetical protein